MSMFTQKCKACDKLVYPLEQIAADGSFYHTACFRCHHCHSTLKILNYASMEGVPYCKIHLDQLLKSPGGLSKTPEKESKTAEANLSPAASVSSSFIEKESKTAEANLSAAAVSPRMLKFQGTVDKCIICDKTVYPVEKVSTGDVCYHKTCFKCTYGGCSITLSNYQGHDGKLYCRNHYSQLMKEKVPFNHVGGKKTTA